MAFAHLYFNAYGDNFYSSWCIHIHWNSGIHTNTLSLLLVPYLWLWIDMCVSCWNKVKIQITKLNWKFTSTKDPNKLISNIFLYLFTSILNGFEYIKLLLSRLWLWAKHQTPFSHKTWYLFTHFLEILCGGKKP